MNKTRRKLIADAQEKLKELAEQMKEGFFNLETAHEEEEAYFDEMPENLQEGEKGQRASEVVDNLCEAKDEIESNLDTIIETLENLDYE